MGQVRHKIAGEVRLLPVPEDGVDVEVLSGKLEQFGDSHALVSLWVESVVVPFLDGDAGGDMAGAGADERIAMLPLAGAVGQEVRATYPHAPLSRGPVDRLQVMVVVS